MPRPRARCRRGRDRRAGRRGGDAVGTHAAPVDLTEIDVIILDKDGTLLDFDAMWGGWARELGDRLDAAVRRPVSPDVFATIGFDPSSGRVTPGGPLATATMAEIESTVATVLRRWCPSVSAARQATEAAWFTPDPARLAVPVADLGVLFARLRADGRRIAVATTDDRHPTDVSLRTLGVRELVEAMVCGDDGFAPKPAPDAVFAICQAFRSEPARCVVVGDTPTDLAMGRAAGAGLVIGVLTGIGSATDLADADVILDSVASLMASAG